MRMQAESLEVLEKASVAPAQARAFVRAIEIELAGAKDTLATKQDLLVLRQDFDALRVELRGEMTNLGANVDVQLAQLRTEIARSVGGVTRQMYMAILGQMAVLLGFAYLFATQLR